MNPKYSAKPILEIDLARLQENYLLAKSKVGTANTSAVIKANAYGLGSKEAMQALYSVGCRDFYVVYIEEAMELRSIAHGNERVYVISPQNERSMREIIQNGFIPVLNTMQDINIYKKFIAADPLPCVIQFDTAMNRMGLRMEEIDSVDLRGLNVLYVMSHLACADEPDHPLNKKQLDDVLKLKEKFNTKISFANSSGIFLGEQYHFNQVRPGCMLYGVNPTPDKTNPMNAVAKVFAKVLRIVTTTAEETVSYGAHHKAKAGTRIATLGIGYADGYHRILSGKGFAHFKGYNLPVLGRVTMDYIMVDASAIPEQLLQEFDYAEVLGDNVTVDETARLASTIGYEILTSLQHRFNRVYTR